MRSVFPVKIRSFFIRYNLNGRKYPVHDLRTFEATAMEAYYRHNGNPCIVRIRLAECRWFGASGLSYANNSYHPYVRTLVNYRDRRCVAYEGSYLEHYWKCWKPKNLAEYFGLKTANCHKLLSDTPPVQNFFPWSPVQLLEHIRAKLWKANSESRGFSELDFPPARSCGPKPRWFGEKRFAHLVEIFRSIEANGYQPADSEFLRYSRKHIVGNCLIRNGETRIIIANGQHRAAGLASLGYNDAPVIVHCNNGRGPNIVRAEDLDIWPMVRLGIFSNEDALAVFNRIFDGKPPDGLKKAILEIEGLH